ncbi:MAG: outer membrane beta-barrel protein, partial [Sediminibacterium sp.]|nr:outer membrane beta-barrel protein [Sediminibacterium sp.]
NREMTTKNHASSFKNVVICPTDRKIRNTDWDLEVFVSPDMPFKTVTNNTASPQLLSRKDSSESLKLGFSAGFRIVKPLNDHFAIKTGLQYSQINEHFTYRTENETRTTTVVTVRAIIRAPGDTLLVRDTSTLTQIGYKTNTVKNRFRSLDIPVLASYQFGHDDLSIGLTAGVIVNLSSWYQGVILDSSLTAVPLSKETNMVYKSNIGLGLYAGLTVSKRINYATQLFFEPYLRYNLSNMTNPEAAFNQRFSIGGLAMGLRFNLNKR